MKHVSGSTTGFPVVLFKSPSDNPHQPDVYETQLSSAGFRPIWIPVLTERWVLTRLISILREGPKGKKGVVISSKRGAEAWMRAVSEICIYPASTHVNRDWSDVPLYAVGTGAVELLDNAELPAGWRPGKRKTVTAKSANALLPLIDPPSTSSPTSSTPTPPHAAEGGPEKEAYLILRGDKSLDTLLHGLRDRGEQVEEVVVYETLPRDDLSFSLDKCFEELQSTGQEVWLAFFAPSSAAMVLPQLRTLGLLPPRSRGENGELRSARTINVFAIGETTAAFLREEGVKVDAVAEEPTAVGMVRAMQSA